MKVRMILILTLLALLVGVMPLAAQDAAACEYGFRPFVDVTGEPICVPDVPERIVAIHDINAGAQVLSLGGPLVGMASREDGFRADVARYFDLEVIVDIGGVYEPNLERILELQPDLIVHEGFDGQLFLVDDEMLATLQSIAPVVAIDAFRPVEEVMADYQELLGDAATVALEDQQETFSGLLTDIEDILGDDWQNVTASYVDLANDGTLQIWGPTALVPLDILTRVGVTWVPIQQEAGSEENGGFIGGFSLERIDELNADLTLVDVRFTPDTVDNPLYQQLTAVQAGQVIILDEPFSGTHYPNYIATAEMLLDGLTALDDIDTDLVDEPEAEAAACDAGLRLFDHEYLATDPVCIPEDPQRIIAIDESVMADFIALGIQPVGVHDWGNRDFTAYLDTPSVASVGTPEGPNLEAILALDPDLIVGRAQDMEWYADDFLENLQRIAPVVLSSNDDTNWESDFLLRGAVVNREELAQQLLDAYEDRLAEFRSLTSELDSTIAIIRSRADAFNIYVGDYFIVDLVDTAGLQFPETFSDLPSPNSISLEEIDMLDSDYLFVMVRNEDEAGYFEQATESPLWSFLPAVQQEQVYRVNWSTWVAGWNIVGAHLVVDDLFGYFTDTVSTTPNPFAELVTEDYAPEQTANDTTEIVCEDGFHAVTDATDTTVCLPENPQRIVALSEVDIDALLALDVEPIAVTNGRGQGTPPGFLMAYLPEDVTSTGTFFQPNLEVILEANPDLILFAGFTDPDVLEQLNAIAPVYNAATFAEPWQVHLTRLGEALGMEDEAAAIIADYETRVDGLREALGEGASGEFVVVRWAAEGPQIMAPRTLSSAILIDLGFMPPAEIPELEEGHAHTPPLSLETLDLIDVDWAFVGTLQGEGDAADALQATLGSPLFQSLDIVQNDRVFVVDGSIWTSVGGYIGATIILDDIEAAMLGEA